MTAHDDDHGKKQNNAGSTSFSCIRIFYYIYISMDEPHMHTNQLKKQRFLVSTPPTL